MELAYRLAADESLYVRNIREHVITLITPVVEVDGRDRIVDAYEWRKKHPKETPMSNVYWGHYVQHDNNRDAMGLTLKLANVLDTPWLAAQVLHACRVGPRPLRQTDRKALQRCLDPILTRVALDCWNT